MPKKNKSALLVVDVQRDFCPGGSLAVKDGDSIVETVNRYIGAFVSAGLPVYASRDLHPPVTRHFKEYGGAWPAHCVQGTEGALFHPGMRLPATAVVITKGDKPDAEGYSAFDGHTGGNRAFSDALKADNVARLYVCGLATDYCVRASALDAIGRGFSVTVLIDAIKGVNLKEKDSESALDEMTSAGADTATIEGIKLG